METIAFGDVKVGDVVQLPPDVKPSNGAGRRYATEYLDQRAAFVTTRFNPSSHPTYAHFVEVEVLTEAGGIERKWVDNHLARFAVLCAEEKAAYLARRAEASKHTPMILVPGTGRPVGSDPEIFAVDENGVVIPAWTYLKTKEETAREYKETMAYTQNPFWDGFQAEFTVPPNTCHEQLMYYIRIGLGSVWMLARKVYPKATLTAATVLEVPEEVMHSASDQHAGLGCAPSRNAYRGVAPLSIADGRTLPIRFAGCHYHMTIDNSPAKCTEIVRAMDAIYGIASVAALRGLEDPRRREYYGRAGEYRTPIYGIEYRVPSSAILCHPLVAHLCFDLMRASAMVGERGVSDQWKVKGGPKRVQAIINTLDVDGALAVLKENEPRLKEILSKIYYRGGGKELAFDMLLKGVSEHVNTKDLVENWQLKSEVSVFTSGSGYHGIYWHVTHGER